MTVPHSVGVASQGHARYSFNGSSFLYSSFRITFILSSYLLSYSNSWLQLALLLPHHPSPAVHIAAKCPAGVS